VTWKRRKRAPPAWTTVIASRATLASPRPSARNAIGGGAAPASPESRIRAPGKRVAGGVERDRANAHGVALVDGVVAVDGREREVAMGSAAEHLGEELAHRRRLP
jgi:hypothetical protein